MKNILCVLVAMTVLLTGTAFAQSKDKPYREEKLVALADALSGTKLTPYKPTSVYRAAQITWGGDIATVLGALEGIYKAEGINVQFYLDNDLKRQCEAMMKGELHFLRLTMGQAIQAAPAFEKAGTDLVVLVQLTWSSGGDGGADFGGFADPFDIFESIFGSSSPFGRQARLPRYGIGLDFMEAVHGTTKEVAIEGKKQKIKIPAGVDDDSEIKFSNFIIVCDVRPHSKFKRRGFDIVTEEEISFSQAALGFEKTVETIDGAVKIRIPAGTQPGTQIRLKSRGVKHVSSHGVGDHYIIIRIKIPTKLSRRQKELLEELESSS